MFGSTTRPQRPVAWFKYPFRFGKRQTGSLAVADTFEEECSINRIVFQWKIMVVPNVDRCSVVGEHGSAKVDLLLTDSERFKPVKRKLLGQP